MAETKYLVYEAFEPPYERPQWRAVDASGKLGYMVGVRPMSRVYSWYAPDAQQAIERVVAFLAQQEAKK